MTRWRWGFAGTVLATAICAGPAVTAHRPASTADDIAALVPGDADDLSTDETGQIIDRMLTLVGDDPAASGDGSSELTGTCGGFAFSFDDDGELIDAAYDAGDDAPPRDLVDGGQAFTSGNPFVVDTGGKVTYLGFAPREGDGPQDHTYSVKVAGFEIDGGGDPNAGGKNRNAGTIEIADELPIDLSVAFTVTGRLDAPDFAGCFGRGHVEFRGAGLFGPVGLLGLGLTAFGAVAVFVSRPARTWRR